MRKTFLMNCVLFACLLAASDCFADTRNVEALIDEKLLLPAYKLGGSYKSKNDNSVSCLEGHTGAILNNKKCLAGNKEPVVSCTDSECKDLGEGYYCSKTTKKCEQSECSDTSSSYECSEAYAKAMADFPDITVPSELRSCVANESKDGGHYCKVTCSLEHIIAKSGLTQAEADRMLNLMRLDMLAYKKPSKALEYYRELTFDKDNPDANGIWDAGKFELLMGGCSEGEIDTPLSLSYVFSPACSAAAGSAYGYRDETGGEPKYGRSEAPYPAIYRKPEYNKSDSTFFAYIAGPYDVAGGAGRYNRFYNCATPLEFRDSGTSNERSLMISYREIEQVGKATANSIRARFESAMDNKSTYDSLDPELAARLGVPDIYYLGKSPLCALYNNRLRNQVNQGFSGYSTVYMFYIPQQDVVTWRRYKKEGNTEFNTYQWDLNTGDRIACCADAVAHQKIINGKGVYCIDLTNDYDVVDIE